jgi:hypothetical protein
LITFSGSDHTVHLASKVGHFPGTPALVEQTVEMEWSPTAVASGDFDADGVEDLLMSHGGSDGFISRYLAAETDRAVATDRFAVGYTAKLYETLGSDKDGRLGDVNGDGLLDSVLLDTDNDQIWIMLAEKDAGIGTEQVLVPTAAVVEAVGVEYLRAAADMNRDGFDDLIVSGSSSVSVWTSLHSDGVWSWDFDTSHVASSVSADTAMVTDIDLDGYVDVIGDDFTDLTFSFGDGDGNLPASCTVAVGENITGVAVGFFDADSIPDVAVTVGTAATNNRVRVYRGSTTRCVMSEATQTNDTSMLGFVTGLITRDLDGDGALDLIASTRSVSANTEPGVYVWRGSSVGGYRIAAFHEPVRISTSRAGALAVSDHNSDGLLDIAFVETSNDAWVTARGSRGNPWVPWSVSLTFEPDSSGWMLVEETAAPTAGIEDRFGDQREFRLHRRIYTGVEPRQNRGALAGQFIAELHAEGLLDSSAFPITAAWDTGSRLALRSVSADDLPALPAFTGRRMQLFERFAPLDAAQGPDLAENRGLHFCLPLHDPYHGVDLSGYAVRVLSRRDRFVRADEWPADAFFGMAAAHQLLPRTEEDEGRLHAVFRSDSTWLELTRDGNDDLSDGSGIRFAVDDPSAATEICLETDQLGIFQAFAVRP